MDERPLSGAGGPSPRERGSAAFDGTVGPGVAGEGPRSRSWKATLDRVVEQVSRAILGKEQAIRLALTCLVARGHLLIEDVPGVGKTTLAHALARSLGLSVHRIQFTSDLLPADILGVSVYDRDSGRFEFHPGPIFAQVVLADEVNRATPKAQSALLEAMEEHQVTLEGQTRPLPEPFFVIATQNPSYQVGTFPLPESQLDRFLMRLELGYPSPAAERELFRGQDRRDMVQSMRPCLKAEELVLIQRGVPEVHVSEPLLDYLQALVLHSRQAPEIRAGLSPRAGVALLRSARAWALLHGRDHVVPDDVQAVLPGVVGHRLRLSPDRSQTIAGGAELLLAQVPVP
jgi:MoxR-like ATPase